jgi:hypothetical protein
MDDSERDDLKLGLDELRDRDALGRLPKISSSEAAEAEREAADMLYPERSVRSQPQPQPRDDEANIPVPRDVRLSDVVAAINVDQDLDEAKRGQLRAFVRALSYYYATHVEKRRG